MTGNAFASRHLGPRPDEIAEMLAPLGFASLDALTDAVTERLPVFDESVLGEIPIVDLLTQPVHVLAEQWRGRG